MKKIKRKSMYHDSRPIFGIQAIFYILVGSRGCGKTYSTQNFLLRNFFKKGNKALWLRLKEPAVKALLQNDAKDFIDSKLIEKWKITGAKTEGNSVYITRGDPKNRGEYKEFCKIMALSTFYQMKGVALNKSSNKTSKIDDKTSKSMIKRNLNKYRNIVLDEMNAEKCEKKTIDITYAFVNQLETICRLDLDRRIILTGNTLDEASDILSRAFNFIPNEFGLYRLYNKKAVIYYMDDSIKYKEARKNSIAGILSPDESTFTNIISSDVDLLTSEKPGNQSFVIKFSNRTYFTVCGNIITKQKIQQDSSIPIIAMRPYLTGLPYYKEKAEAIILRAQQRTFKFDMLITLKQFYNEIQLLKQ